MTRILLDAAIKSILPLIPSGSTVTIDIQDFTARGKSKRKSGERDILFSVLSDEYDGFFVESLAITDLGKNYHIHILVVKE